MSENLKKNEIRGGKKSAMKLFSNVSTVTQATFNLESVKKTGYASDSERMLPRRKRLHVKRGKHFILAAEVFRTSKI